jgi:hypothetical protein
MTLVSDPADGRSWLFDESAGQCSALPPFFSARASIFFVGKAGGDKKSCRMLGSSRSHGQRPMLLLLLLLLTIDR